MRVGSPWTRPCLSPWGQVTLRKPLRPHLGSDQQPMVRFPLELGSLAQPHAFWGLFCPRALKVIFPCDHGFTCLYVLALGKSEHLTVIKVWSHEDLKVFLQP